MTQRKKRPLLGNLLLLLTAVIWGSAFVAQRGGMEYVGPFTFNCIRCALGALVLMPVIFVRVRIDAAHGKKPEKSFLWLKAGVLAGIAMFLPASFQQYGLLYTTSGKAGFITSLYMIVVPLVLWLFMRRRVSPFVWLSVGLACIGMYMLCCMGVTQFNKGDALELVCGILWAGQILVIDHYSDKVDCLRLVCVEFAVCALLSLPLMLIFEQVSIKALMDAALPIGYAGFLSCGVAYTLQPIGQRETSPAVATIIMSMESVFAAIFGALLMHERFTAVEFAGCALIFCAVLLSQIPWKEKKSGEKA